MIRLKHILTMIFLMTTAGQLLAQESYVIDSVCVGAERIYRHDGGSGYTYDWYIVDIQASDTIPVNGVDFMEINADDTTWGNEIFQLWDKTGDFDIFVQVFSEHGCDTIEQGIVRVFELPGVDAGEPQVLCSNQDIVTLTDTAWNYSGLYWESTGDGSFDDLYALHPTYSPGPNDSIAGTVTLILTAYGMAENVTCEPAVDSVTHYFSEPELAPEWEDPICYNDSNAWIKVSVSGGLPPFRYEWEGPAGFVTANSDSIGGLWAGTYYVTVFDANDCKDTDTIEIVNPPQLITSIDSVRDVSCYAYADGFIWTSASGGTGELYFSWEGPDGFVATGDSIYNLAGGTYILTVRDDQGCENIDTVEVLEPDPLIAVIDTFFDVQCYGFANGAAHVTVTAGTGPYTYSWNSVPEQDSVWAIDLGPGWYTAAVTDFNGCMAWDSVYIDEPDLLVVMADSIDVRCDGDKPGEIHLQVSGGNRLANAPFYYFDWRNQADSLIATTQDIYGLAGNQYYTVTVTDSLGCADTLSVYVNEIPMMQMEVSIDTAPCYGDPWSIDLTITQGRLPYTYAWTDTSGTVVSTDEDRIDVPAGIYTVTVVDADSCILTQTWNLEEPPLVAVNITATDSILCYGERLVMMGNPQGGTGALTHTWTGNGNSTAYLNPTDRPNVLFSDAAPGEYSFIYTIVDQEGCDASDTFDIGVYPPSYFYDTLEVCAFSAPLQYNENITITSDADRIYHDTIFGGSQYGCDSLITVDVKVLFPEYYDTTIYVCENDPPYQPYGNITIYPDRDSIYLDTVPYVESGCDSLLITINVISYPLTYSEHDSTLCAGAGEFWWNNRLIQTDSSQTYLDTLYSANQFECDSVLTYFVTIIAPDTTFADTSICEGSDPFVWHTTSKEGVITVQTDYDSTYLATLPNQFGCDSVVIMDVQLRPKSITIIDTLLCYNETDSWPWNSREVYMQHDSTYLDTLPNQWGCDSLLFLNVTIMYPDTTTIDTTICEGEPVFAWGVNTIHQVDSYTDSIYTDVLQNQFGCDSIVYLDVEILRPAYFSDTLDYCENDPVYTWYSHTILTDRDSIYYDTLYYAQGCDSLRLQLEIHSHPVYDFAFDTILCEGSDAFAWNSHTVSTFVDSLYIDSLQTVWGCDSIVSLDVKIVPAFKDTLQDEFCFDSPAFDWFGQSVSTQKDSVYIHNVPGPGGCDTLIFYEVTILPVTDSVLDLTYCYGTDPFQLNNRWIQTETSDVYFDTVPNTFGCDSLLTYVVTISPPDTTPHYDTICFNSAEFDWNGLTVQTQTDDIYVANVPDSDGCDSIAILYTTIIDGGVTYDTIFACEQYTWTEGTGLTYFVSDDYFHTVGGNIGCADTSWLHLVISPPIVIAESHIDVDCYGNSSGSVSLLVSGGVPPYTYEWSTGATTDTIGNLPAGIYSVIVWDSLSDTLSCEQTLTITISEPQPVVITELQITHVDVVGEATGSIEVEVSGGTKPYRFEWVDALGTVVDTTQNLYNQPAGVYTLFVYDANDCPAQQTFEILQPEITPCIDDTTLLCYEDLAAYPLITSLEEYITHLRAEQTIDPGCGVDTASFSYTAAEITGNGFCYEELRTYILLDLCGDTIFHCEQTVIVDDKVPPTIDCPADFSVSNGIVPNRLDSITFLARGGSFDDNCGIVRFEMIDEQSDGLSNPETITRVYEVEDHCGNLAQCSQVITVYTTAEIALECSGLPKVYYECRDYRPNYRDIADFDLAGGNYYSSVPIDTFFYKDVVSGTYCPTITRTYTLRNVAGQDTTCTQVFQVLDNEAPYLNLPDVHIYCDEAVPDAYTGGTSAINDIRRDFRAPDYDIDTIIWDNCGINSIRSIGLSKSDEIEPGCPTVITRYYRIDDYCNNRRPFVQKIYIYDTIPPVITNFEPLVENPCDLPPVYPDAALIARDDCESSFYTGALTITRIEEYSGGIAEPDVFYRRYYISDGCNEVDTLQKIIIKTIYTPTFDTIAPLCQFTAAPVLPDTSLNGYTGYWSPATISTDSAGLFNFTFVPDSGQCASPVNLEVEVRPAIGVYEDLHVDQGYNPDPVGEIRIGVNNGTTPFDYLWSNGDSTNYIDSLAAGFYTVYVNDAIGCFDSLTVEITAAQPVLACIPDTAIECPDPSQYPPANTISEFMTLGGYYEPLSIVANFYAFDKIGDRDSCLSIDRYYYIEDIYGRVDSCVQHVDFYDNVPPLVFAPQGDTVECLSSVVKDISSYADFLNAGGSVDAVNCTLDYSTFTVSDTSIVLGVGRSEVIFYFSIADFCGNVGYDTTRYIVTDDQAPEVFCADITVYLDDDGKYRLTIRDSITLVDSVYDNCTAPEDLLVVVDIKDMDCSDVDFGSVATVTVWDEAGLSASCPAKVIVLDTVPPTAICQDLEVTLDANGQVSITASQIDNGSYDNCAIESITLSKDNFDCTNVGANIVQLRVTDVHGNSAVCAATVTVIDAIPPYISCIILDTVQLSEENGTFALIWEMVADSVWDECGIDRVELDRYLLDCYDIGTTTITATAYDVNGNPSSCTAQFVVLGNIAPVALPDYDTTRMDKAVTVNVIENDYDLPLKTEIDTFTLTIRDLPQNGSVAADRKTGLVTYTPALGFVGVDSFKYEICDDGIPCEPECAKTVVYILVLPANEPPVAGNDTFYLPCGDLQGNVLFNDTDPDGDPVWVDRVLVEPVNGTLVYLDETGDFFYEPFFDFQEGVDSFQYVMRDEVLFGESLYDTAWVFIYRVADNDCDGVADVDDIDDDNDGIRDIYEGLNEEFPNLSLDSDQDGIPDYLDLDSDNDGILDNIEGQGEHSYIAPDGWRDENNNGWDDRYDEFLGGYAFDLNLNDHDGDGTPDFRDIDSDNDNVLDYIEGHDYNADGIPDVTRFFGDLDGDGLDDAYDIIDGWGISDLVDNESGSNAPLQDFDGDGWRDWRDTNDEDDEYMTIDEDINGNGDYSDDDLDLDGHPEYLDTEMDCELFIPEGFSPNDDGVHDFFQILCIYPRYPDAKMMIFNRNGQKLWEKEKYGNFDYWGWNDAWWWGTVESRLVIGRSGGLPAGNYIYVLLLNDGLGTVKNGTVMVAY